MSRSQIKVVGIAQNNLRAEMFRTKIFKDVLWNGFDCPRGSHRHESGCFNRAVGGGDARRAGMASLRLNHEGKGHRNMVLAGRRIGSLIRRKVAVLLSSQSCFPEEVAQNETHSAPWARWGEAAA